jgi:hypothetical protein
MLHSANPPQKIDRSAVAEVWVDTIQPLQAAREAWSRRGDQPIASPSSSAASSTAGCPTVSDSTLATCR